jgi:hypothetical protein
MLAVQVSQSTATILSSLQMRCVSGWGWAGASIQYGVFVRDDVHKKNAQSKKRRKSSFMGVLATIPSQFNQKTKTAAFWSLPGVGHKRMN